MKITDANKSKLRIELKNIRQQADLMLHGLNNDNDFPLQEDFESIEYIEAKIFEIKKIIVKS